MEEHGFLPWQAEAWQRLQARRRDDRLPHALLITGAAGIGKGRFAHALAASLLCSRPQEDGTPCGACQGCHWFRAGSHPDYGRLEPEEPGKAIRVDAVRAFVDGEGLTSQAGGYKLLVIEPAEAMNQAAANSLLKTLEEPVPWTLMLLISSDPGRLPATIRSRCQRLHFDVPAPDLARDWLRRQGVNGDPDLLLALAAGAPLKARELADPEILAERSKLLDEFAAILAQREDPVALAARWSRLPLERLLEWYSGWLIDSLRLKADPAVRDLINPDQRKRLQAIGERVESDQLYRLLDEAYRVIRSLGTPLNPQLTLEDLLLTLAASIDRQRTRQ